MSKKVNSEVGNEVLQQPVVNGKVDAMEYITTNGYPAIGVFEDKKCIQKFYKQLPIDVLEDWATSEDIEYKPCGDNEAIHRMRVCMAILYKHFPRKASTKTKKTGKYSDYTLETLLNMCISHEVPVDVCDDQRILRMRAIMMLRAHKVLE